ncbi:LarC family nickel insertion protein [Brachybacterium timonense]|uniref:LarC family nickel insertion protein n=1 Tax=Brachybacterium timonense TaxID=2050896 RepID=UPI000D0AF8B4|nr:LarC family nickel insertion protein [Brachybacterium timonense]
MQSTSRAATIPTPSSASATPSPPVEAAPALAWIDATAGVAGDMLLGALVDAGASLKGVQAVLDALIPGSVRLRAERVDRCGQASTKVDVDVLVEDPPHRTWSSIRDMLTTAQQSGAVPARTCELALDAFSRLADAEAAAHGIPAEQIHFHEVGALDSIADVVGCCEAWRQLGIESGIGSVIAVGSGRIRAAHGDIPVPVPAVARLAIGWPTVSGELLPPRGHGHAHGHGHDHTHHHGHEHAHSHDDGRPRHHSHPHAHNHHDAHPQTDSHDHPHDPHDHEANPPAHTVGGPHAHPDRPVPPGVAPGIGELATPTGVALIRALCQASGPQPPIITQAMGIGAGTKDTPGRPNVVRVLIGAPAPVGPSNSAASPREAPASDATPTTTRHEGSVAAHPAGSAAADAHDTPRHAVQLDANVDDLDPRLWPGVVQALLDAGALDAWLTPIIMKHGRPALTVHALVRTEQAEALSEQIMRLTGSLGVRRHPVQRAIRTREFEEITLGGQLVRVKVSRDDSGQVIRREPEFRDVAAAASALGITEREALETARIVAARQHSAHHGPTGPTAEPSTDADGSST